MVATTGFRRGKSRSRRSRASGTARRPPPRSGRLWCAHSRRGIGAERTRRVACHDLCRAQTARAQGAADVPPRRQHPRAWRTGKAVFQAASGGTQGAEGLARDVSQPVARLRGDPRPRVNAMQGLPLFAATLSRLIPAADREPILGDLLEDAADRDLSGTFLTIWLCGQCGAIATGLTIDRFRNAFTVPPIREMVSGLAVDGTHAFRDAIDAPWTVLVRAVVFCA